MKRSFPRWLGVSSTLGVLVPIANLLLWKIVVLAHGPVFTPEQRFQFFNGIGHSLLEARIITWPTSILLMADTVDETFRAWLVLAFSILTNVVLYSVVGWAVWRLRGIFIRMDEEQRLKS
jgi:hypothetical protein